MNEKKRWEKSWGRFALEYDHAGWVFGIEYISGYLYLSAYKYVLVIRTERNK